LAVGFEFLTMSAEFKFACPVCAQHIACDSSHSGSVMDCPTCFQPIIAPQAPAAGHKFILIGARLSAKKTSVWNADMAAVRPKKLHFLPAFLIVALVLVAGAGVFFFGKTCFPGWFRL
jgi:hypothetical protein